jgi:hypothetical protein
MATSNKTNYLIDVVMNVDIDAGRDKDKKWLLWN